jgi:hypothetical protein
MNDYDDKTNRYQITWEDSQQNQWIPRLDLLFLSEDPFLFAKRLGYAHSARRDSEALMVILI